MKYLNEQAIKEKLDSMKDEYIKSLTENIHSKVLAERKYTVFTESEIIATDLNESAMMILLDEVEGAQYKAQPWH